MATSRSRTHPHRPPPQLQEFGSTYESEVLRNKKKLELADVLIFVYDSSDTNSFSYVSNLRVRVSHCRRRFVAAAAHLTITSFAALPPRTATIQAR